MLENDLNPTTKPTTVFLKDYRPPLFNIVNVDLHFDLDEITTVTSILTVQRAGQHTEPLILDGEKLSLQEVVLDDQQLTEADYQLDQQSLTLDTKLDHFTLKIVTQLEPSKNTELSGLYQSSGNFCTQCEAEGFRRITYFLDRPDVLSKYTVTLQARQRSYPVLLSNGNLVAQAETADRPGFHWAKWHDPHPKPSYLFALVAGDLQHISDHYTTVSGNLVALNIYTQAHNINFCQHAMESLKNSMRWDEQVYGREYDLSVYNIVAVDDFNMGAMENKGLNIFNSKYVLADQQTATDTDFEGIESVIAHEYFHNWSGNRVTCRDWFQLSLKEGFTVFRDQEFSADMGSRAVKRIKDVQMLRAYQFKEDAGPMAHPVRPSSYQEINNFYTATIYNKGAEVIRMMHSLLGEQGFRRGTDLYFDSFDGQAVTTEDFVTCMEQANAVDLAQFRLWYTQAGTPEVTVQSAFDNGNLTLTMQQHCPATPGQQDKSPFQIPVKIALFYTNGEKVLEQTLSLQQASQTFQFDDLDSEPVVSILRDFSAPIKLRFERDSQALATLIGVDDNGFARWEAMQQLCLNVMLPAINTHELDESLYQTLLTAFKSLIESNPSDKAIFAEMLTLPSVAYISGLVSPLNPIVVAQTRQTLVSRLARDLESQFHALFANNNHRADFSLSGQAMAERALKNRALAYLVETDQAAYHALASHQYHNASNMTDRLAAFAALIHADYPDRQMLIDDFYHQWHSHTLVLDKWFALQAMTPDPSALNIVERLLNHADFSINNPNKVRAVIGAFTANAQGFHRIDGKGYALLADKVIQLNTINPQIAARLVSVFNSWRDHDEPFKSMMQQQLQRIDQHNDLASDVSEIVSKALLD